jgi:type 1 glutamine amidotransferase
MQVGVICHDYWHPGMTIMEGLQPLAAAGIVFDAIEDVALCTEEWLSRHDVLIIAKANEGYEDGSLPWISKSLEALLLQYVEQGKGLLVLHSGLVGWSEEPAMLGLIGGVFTSHPHACPVTMEMTEDAGPVFGDAERFTMHDEHYFVDTPDDRNQLFMISRSEHGVQPAGWVRTHGAGRVCALTPGHFLEALREPGYQAVISRAVQWCTNGSMW